MPSIAWERLLAAIAAKLRSNWLLLAPQRNICHT
jgi:hypothetical protein